MRNDSSLSPGVGRADGGLHEDALVLRPPPYRPQPADEHGYDALRLAPPIGRVLPSSRRRRWAISLPLALAGWAAVLGGALGVAYATQPTRQLDGQADLPAPAAPAPSAVAELGGPATAPSIASQSSAFAAPPPPQTAEVAPPPDTGTKTADAPAPSPPPLEVKSAPLEPLASPAPPAAQDAGGAPSEPAVAAKAPAKVPVPKAPVAKSATAKAATDKPPIEKSPIETSAAAKAPVVEAKASKASDSKASDAKASVAKTTKSAPPAAAKQAVAEDAPAGPHGGKPEKASPKTAAADAGDIPQLKSRMSHAYAEAVKAGTPKSVLKARQAEWAVLRAKAEKKGPAAVAALYRTRTAQLEALAKKSATKGHAKT
jgi:hypothetical protein